MNPHPIERRPASQALLLCALNWLLPGLGFILVGDRARGLILLVLLNAIFVVGVAMGGTLLAPQTWNPLVPGAGLTFNGNFNLVGVLQYIAQVFHGGGSIALHLGHAASADNPGAFLNLHRLSSMPLADLGSLHLVVAGSLNYFATIYLWDVLAGRQPEGAEVPLPAESKAEENAS